MDAVVATWKERILAADRQRPLRVRGGGSKDFYGGEAVGEVLDTRAHRGIVDYEPTELVITARAGTPLADIESTLAGQGQMLASEPPRFGAATMGGAVAAGLSGPRRATAGALRDFVLGVRLLDGEGRLLEFGGRVMKNVAGYDVSRLLCGSLGTLGVLIDVSIKVLPRPATEASLRFELDQGEALQRMNRWAGQPLPISASCWHEGAFTVRLSGARAAVAAAQTVLGGEALAEPAAADFWSSLREQSHPFFAEGGAPLWRLSLPSTAGAIEMPGTQLIEWGGAQRWLRGTDGDDYRRVARTLGGHATLFRGGNKGIGVFQAPAPAVAALHERLKAAFDPRRVLNPGRLFPDL